LRNSAGLNDPRISLRAGDLGTVQGASRGIHKQLPQRNKPDHPSEQNANLKETGVDDEST